MKFHQCIKHKQVLDRTIKLHAAALPGPRPTGDMIRDGISDDGVIDEPKFHSYSIRKDLERQKLVAKHFLGDEADLQDCFYEASDDTANWNWNNEFSDHYAALVIDGVSVTTKRANFCRTWVCGSGPTCARTVATPWQPTSPRIFLKAWSQQRPMPTRTMASDEKLVQRRQNLAAVQLHHHQPLDQSGCASRWTCQKQNEPSLCHDEKGFRSSQLGSC